MPSFLLLAKLKLKPQKKQFQKEILEENQEEKEGSRAERTCFHPQENKRKLSPISNQTERGREREREMRSISQEQLQHDSHNPCTNLEKLNQEFHLGIYQSLPTYLSLSLPKESSFIWILFVHFSDLGKVPSKSQQENCFVKCHFFSLCNMILIRSGRESQFSLVFITDFPPTIKVPLFFSFIPHQIRRSLGGSGQLCSEFWS